MAVLFSISNAALGLFGVMCWVLTAESFDCHKCAVTVKVPKCDGGKEECTVPGGVCVRRVELMLVNNSISKFFECLDVKLQHGINLRNRCATAAELKNLHAIEVEEALAGTIGKRPEEYKLTELCGCTTELCNTLEFSFPNSGPSHRTSFTSVIALLLFLFAEYF